MSKPSEEQLKATMGTENDIRQEFGLGSNPRTPIVSTQAAQGDVLFRRIDKLPANAKEQTQAVGKSISVAHSETGHHHTVDATGTKWYQGEDPMVCYLQLAENRDCVDVIHHRPDHTHGTFSLLGKGSIWEVRRQREETPEGWTRQVLD